MTSRAVSIPKEPWFGAQINPFLSCSFVFRPAMRLAGIVTLAFAAAPSVLGYVPAVPTNNTQEAIAGGVNITEASTLYIQWASKGYN